jgi:uncharacterized protein YidB (DUF937 family)
MSFLDSLKAAVAKDSEARRNVEAVLAVAGDKAKGGIAGLGGLVDRLKDSELADNVTSWVSNSANRLPSAEQVQRALGADAIGRAAKNLGVSGREAADRVAKALPAVIDNISPTGKLPENLDHIGDELMAMLKTPKGKAIAAGAVAGAAALAGVAAAVIARGKAKPKAAPAKPAAKPKAAAKPAAKPKAAAKPATKPAAKKPAAKKPTPRK